VHTVPGAKVLVTDRQSSYGSAKPLNATAAALANTSVFSTCSTRELKKVAKIAKFRSIGRGSRLMQQNDHGESMFVILSGIARVSRNGRKVASLGAGDVAGELAVLRRAPRNATVDADTDLEVAEISRVALGRIIAEAPAFARKMLEALAGRVAELDSKTT
jgi:CRP-like cAMP-binding protein